MKKSKLMILLAIIVSAAAITAFTIQDDKITVSGTFTDITRPNITLKTDDGNEYLIHTGPIWFWDENKYSINTNSSAEIYGKIETGKKEIYAYTIKQDGATITLADENGNPLWWKKDGQGKNRKDRWGYGQNNGRGNGNGYRDGSCGNCRCGRW